MSKELSIQVLTLEDLESAYLVFEIAIPDAFEKEGLGDLKEDYLTEIVHKRKMLKESLKYEDIVFLIAKLGEKTIGVISYGPCGSDIRKCTEDELKNVGELGSLYVLPDYQDQGIGSSLIQAMITYLNEQGIKQFCLDSGYKRAQKRWLKKFGAPCKIQKDYWGPGGDHMIWLCNPSDYISQKGL